LTHINAIKRRLNKATSIAGSLLFIGTWTIGASVQALSEEAAASQGHRFALLVCAACHVVATDQEVPPILRTPGPSFDAIANKPGTTGDSLRVFLSTTHAKIAASTSMPNPQLADYQMAEVISYILSLRH
jgi:mono/diheme cytochrome c family protein